MNEDKHPPGPWHIGGKGSAAAPITDTPLRVWAGDRAAVAEISTRRQLGERSPSAKELANASLIAAAPKLLAALRLFVDQCPNDWTAVDLLHRHDIARAAISKATTV